MLLLWEFVAYSFVGFILESLFSLTLGRPQIRKTMVILPLCPVYGLGAVAFITLLTPLRTQPVWLFFAAAAVGTMTEYGYAWMLTVLFGVTAWDYGGMPGSLHGRVNLVFSLIWGALGILLLDRAQPVLRPRLAAIPPAISAVMTVVLALDMALTLHMLRRLRLGGSAWGCPVYRQTGGRFK